MLKKICELFVEKPIYHCVTVDNACGDRHKTYVISTCSALFVPLLYPRFLALFMAAVVEHNYTKPEGQPANGKAYLHWRKAPILEYHPKLPVEFLSGAVSRGQWRIYSRFSLTNQKPTQEQIDDYQDRINGKAN
jgi:hypothetical protein